MITVVVVDDHKLVRRGIMSMLDDENDIQVLAEGNDGFEALELVQFHHPDILILDINMPNLNGTQVVERIQPMNLSTQVIMLSMYSDESLVRQTLKSGARGYLVKQGVSEELLLAVRSIHSGNIFISPGITENIITDYLDNYKEASPLAVLSSRERDIMRLVAEGHSNIEIGENLHLSPRTIEKHRANMMRKLGVKDFASLFRLALKEGVIFVDQM